jgi:hypothetical protein
MQVARTSRLSVGCCSLPFATSVLPHRHRCLATRTQTERLTEHFMEPLDRPTPSSPSTRRTPSRPYACTCTLLCLCMAYPPARSSTPPVARQRFPALRRIDQAFLPWDCRVPLLQHAHLRPLPPSSRPGSDRGMVAAVLVPPLWSLTTSAVCSAAWVPSLLQLGTGHGVRWVSGEPVVIDRRRLGRGPHSHQRFTLRRFTPRRQPFPIAGVCSLLTVHPETMLPPLARRTRVDERVPPCVSRSERACSMHDG